MSLVKFPSKGISGRKFLVAEFVFLVLVFAGGLAFLAPSIQVINNTLDGIGHYLFEVGIKFVLVIAITLVQAYVVFTHVLDTPLTELRQKFNKSRNDSHAYVLVGIIGGAVVALTMARGVNLNQYVYQLCTRAAVGYGIATIAAGLTAGCFGVKSMDDFRDWIDTEDNDSYAILLSGVLVLSMVLAMSA